MENPTGSHPALSTLNKLCAATENLTIQVGVIGQIKQNLCMCKGLDETQFLSVKLLMFSYPSVLTYVLRAQKNRLIETVLLSTHNICFG